MRPLALLLTLLAALPAAAQPDPHLATVDALIADSLAQIGGGAVVLVLQEGEVFHRRAYGTFTPETIVPTASAAKWFSGAVIASLVGDGTLALDDSLATFFPALTGEKRQITVRQLFSHTSGILGSEAGRVPCLWNPATTLAACANAILALPLAHAPGAAFDYGPHSMQVAGRVAEIAAGQPWTQLFADRIAAPLGLVRTGYTSQTNPWIGAGMYTSADETVRFLQMVLDGGLYDGARVLPAEMVDAMLADQTGGAPVAYSPLDAYAGYPGLPPTEHLYGLGVWREQIGTDGTLLEGSSLGATGVAPWIDPERRVAGVLLVQDVLPDVMGTYLDLKRIVRATADGEPVGAEDGPDGPAPATPTLDPPFPNPAGDTATVRYTLPASARIRLFLLDAQGRRLEVLARGRKPQGSHAFEVDTRSLAPGLYHLVLLAGRERRHRTLLVVR